MSAYRRQLTAAVASTVVLLLAACQPAAPAAPTATVASAQPAPTTSPVPPSQVAPTTAPGAASTAGAAVPSASAGQTLRVGIGGYPHSFEPNAARAAPAFSMYAAIFNKLIDVDVSNGGKLVPSLATSWTPTDDTTWTITLRNDVKWHDGTPFTADDVVTTIDRLLHGQPAAEYASRVGSVDHAEAVDPYTVKLVTKTRNAILPIGLADIYMLQAQQLKAGGSDAVNANPIGTGPFRYVSREQGVSVTLARADAYWGPKPNLDGIVFQAYTEDGTRIAALQRNEIDIAFNLPPDDAKRLESQGLNVQWTPIGQGMVIELKTTEPDSPLAKKEVRQALNHAIDKDGLIEGVLLGYSRKLDGQLVGPDGFGYNNQLQPYEYDVQKAKQLLTQAGYANGFPLTFTSSQGRYVKHKEVSEAIVGQLQQVVPPARLNLIEWGAFITGLANHQSGYIGFNYFPTMDADFVLQWFACSSQFKLYCNPAFDDLFQKERAESDPARRVALLQQMQQILHDDAAAVFLFQAPDIFGVSKRVKGFTPTPDGIVHFQTVTLEP